MLALAAGTVCLTSGCSTLGYMAQAATGHLELMHDARPVTDWLAAPDTPETLRERLALSQRMRDFAVTDLHLPDNRSYRSYADLHRRAAVWNVVATPELSLALKTWCFPVVGCIGYRGYYAQADADAEAATLKAQGLEVSVYPVPAYSTLGKMNWLGGDPLLNTFIGWPEGELARLIFHELAHQVAYAPGDTRFNESFATSVERIGGERWLAQHADAAARADFDAMLARRQAIRALMNRARERLVEVYAAEVPDDDKRLRKAAVFEQLRTDYASLKAGWGGYAGYDAAIARANNATLAIQAAYDDLVPAFQQLYTEQGSDFDRYYAAVRRLAALPGDQRQAELDRLLQAGEASSAVAPAGTPAAAGPAPLTSATPTS